MTVVPLGQGTYTRTDSPSLILRNMFYEPDPANLEDGVSLISRYGTSLYFHLATGPVRGILSPGGVFSILNIYVVSGSTLYQLIGGSGGLPLGTIAGFDPSFMVAAGNFMLLTGGGVLYKYPVGGPLSSVTLPAPSGAVSIKYLAGFFLLLHTNSQRIYFSAALVPTFDPLDFFSAESEPDYLVAQETIGDELWLAGVNSVEVYAPTGDPDIPFLKIPGRAFSMGCAGAYAVCKTPDCLVFVGRDHVVYRTSGAPVRISDPAIEQAMAEHLNDTITMWSATIEGHTLVHINISIYRTLVYDLTTGKWSEFTSFGSDRLEFTWSTRDYLDRVLVGSNIDGNLWIVDPKIAKDNGQPVVCEFSAYMPNPGTPQRNDTLILDCSVGIGDALEPNDFPLIECAVSDTRGKLWRDLDPQPLGREGEYATNVAWDGLGMIERPGRLYKFRLSPPERFTVRQVRMNESV